MKRAKDFSVLFRTGWAAAGVLAAAYFAFVMVFVNEDLPRRVLLLFGVCFVAFATVLLCVLRTRVVRFARALEADLDEVLAGRETPGKNKNTDTLLGKLESKLARVGEILQAAAKRNEQEKQAVQSLVSDIAHQVKTPIANVRMYSEILQTRELPRVQQAEFLQHVVQQADRLGFLTDCMVKLSRLETGVVALQPQPGLVAAMLQEVAGALQPEAQRKSIALAVECDPGLQALFDARWCAEALHNIVDNAIKYTHEGGHVEIKAERWEMYTRVTVKDDGPGIPEAEHAAVFGRFVRGAGATGAPGLGIGLYLAREIIARQGGYMLLRSGAGKGAEFALFIPNG